MKFINIAILLTIVFNVFSQTTLERGDLLILGVNANRNSCDGASEGRDEISFVCFKDITTGTTIDITDNGYERCNANQWGDTEGTLRITRTGGTITAGTVITFRFDGNGHTEHMGVSPDNNWTFNSLNGPSNYFNLNNGGDQVYFMQGGTWNNPGGTHDATYLPASSVLFGFSTNGLWTASCSTNPTQHSNKFPGMECFFSNPTSATDFSKYCGPITAATQREWIDRVNNPSNWCTYTDCNSYSSSGYNFASGFTISISPGGFSSGVWVGDASTDWFNCENWQNKLIPNSSTNVTIDQSAINDCIINSGTAVCNNLVVSSNNNFNRNLIVQNTAVLNCSGDVFINKSAGTGILYIELLNSAKLNCQNFSVKGTLAGAENGMFRLKSNNAILTVNGNLTIQTGGALDLDNNSWGSLEGTIQLHGNWVNNETESAFKQGESTVKFIGNANQTISVTGAQPEIFWNLEINKTGGKVILNNNIEVGGSSANIIANRKGILTLTNKVIETGSNYLYVTNPEITSVSGGSTSSFIDGKLRRHTNAADLYNFSVGEGTQYMQMAIRTTNSSENVIEVDAQNSGYGTYIPIEPMPLGLTNVSLFRWWDVKKILGTTPVFIRLYWQTLSADGIVDATKLVVAHWSNINHSGNPSTLQWWNRGRNSINSTGTINNGYVESAESVSTFSPFTFGSIDLINPLPVQLISFTGKCVQLGNKLQWITASEYNNENFILQKSYDGIYYQTITVVPSKTINSNSYNFYEYEDIDVSTYTVYYKLLQSDIDGNTNELDIISLNCKEEFSSSSINILIAEKKQLLIKTIFENATVISINIVDSQGRIITNRQYFVNDDSNILFIEFNPELTSGCYVLNYYTTTQSNSIRFIIP
ncbi:MAG: hypothetical protein N2449_00590 [Bacteroidales bacterium]|nr:hypothetical protein [Bacteroidales bacterium]